MAPIPESHHHRGTTKTAHKPFKSRHATKSLIKELAKGKFERNAKGSRKTPHQQVMSKIDRRNHAKQLRDSKHQSNVKSTSIFAGQNGAPRIVAVVPLCEGCDAITAIELLNKSVDAEAQPSRSDQVRVRVDRLNFVYVPVQRSLLAAMNACSTADFVIFLLSSHEDAGEIGEGLLRAVESQGISNVLTMVQNLDSIQPLKKQSQVVASLTSFISRFFPNQEKIYSLNSDRECANLIRSLCTIIPKGVNWREDRSWMLVEDVQWSEKENEKNTDGDVIITGVVRGKGIKAERLLQIGDWGHFQVEKIMDATLPTAKKRKVDGMIVDSDSAELPVLETPDLDQDDLDELAPYDENMEDAEGKLVSESPVERRGVLLDDQHYYSDGEFNQPLAPKKLPRGISNYQASWFVGDVSDMSSSDDDGPVDEEGDLSMITPSLPQDEPQTSAPPSEYHQSEMFLDPSPKDETDQLEAYRSSRKTSAEEDREFPDEIELHPKVLARERLARYRGLKSFKTSPWDTSEDKAHEPEDWDRLLRIPDHKAVRKSVMREALVGGIPPGKRISIHLRNVPISLRSAYSSSPLSAFSLLRHEQKRTVINCTITLSSSYPNALKSKQLLLFQCGPRRFLINPLFSQTGSTPNDVHKYVRFLHPGQTAMASFIAPVTWGSIPCLFFLPPSPQSQSQLQLIATGTLHPPSPTRKIAKRVILTGHPFKIHKKLVTVRYMFFNEEDVEWFKALRLWTKRGRQGFVKESLGTHGYFKAVFDGRVGPLDAVGVSLYKRVWPRVARAWRLEEGMDREEGEEEVAMVDEVQ